MALSQRLITLRLLSCLIDTQDIESNENYVCCLHMYIMLFAVNSAMSECTLDLLAIDEG